MGVPKLILEDKRVEYCWLTGYTHSIIDDGKNIIELLMKDGKRFKFDYKDDHFQEVQDFLNKYKK